MKLNFKVELPNEFNSRHTSDLARRAFGKDTADLSAERFHWTFKQGYDCIYAVSAFVDDIKIGQSACIIKDFHFGSALRCAELIDLFVDKEYRGFEVISGLYKELKKIPNRQNVDKIYTYANEGAALLNKRFFRLHEITQMPIKIGMAGFGLRLSNNESISIDADATDIAAACEKSIRSEPQSGVFWDSRTLKKRLACPVHKYLSASDEDITVVASPRVIKNIPLLLVCATFCPPNKSIKSSKVKLLIQRLCKVTKTFIYLYAGWNDSIQAMPGFDLPTRFRRKNFQIQSNFLNSQRHEIQRFEIIDIDYA